MGAFFKNISLFIAGFIVAVFITKTATQNTSQFTNSEDHRLEQGLATDTARPQLANRFAFHSKKDSLKNNHLNKFKSSQFESSYFVRNINKNPVQTTVADQNPIPPPTGRTQTEEDDKAKKEKKKKTRSTKKIVESDTTLDVEKSFDNSTDSVNEATISSVSSNIFSGNAITNENLQENAKASGSNGGAVFISRRDNISRDDDIKSQDVLPKDFSSQGVQVAQKLFSEKSISEKEYIDYLGLGLTSNNENRNLAIQNLVSLKSVTSFNYLVAFTKEADSSINQFIDNEIATKYKSAEDLKILSQIISNDQNQEAQIIAINSLNTILRSENLNANDQQILNVIINDVSPALGKVTNTHPAFSLAQDAATRVRTIINNIG